MTLDPEGLRRARAGGQAARSCCSRAGVALATLVLVAVAWTAPARSGTRAPVRPAQALASLLGAHEVFSRPARESAPLGRLAARRPLTGARTVLPVLAERAGADKLGWLRVRLPGRPNGRTGWIRRRGTVASATAWRVVVDTSERRVTVYRRGARVRVFRAVVGKPATPTPRGEFFVEEAVQLGAGEAGAPFALALSARSDVLQEFDGGPGQIALHGLANVGGVPGTAVSHGCVRLAGDAMHWLVVRIGPGVPVTITG